MPQLEGDPLDGQQLANELDDLFRSGNLGRLFASAPAKPEPTEDEVLKGKLNQYMESFVRSIKPNVARSIDRRNAVNQVRSFFSKWKPGMVNDLRTDGVAQPEIQAVEDLTLKDVAVYAGEQFSQASKKAATSPPGSSEQLRARERSDYWSIMQEILSPAADPDK